MADESRGNLFANDGSFMEMFRRLQEQKKPPDNPSIHERGNEDASKSGNSPREVSKRKTDTESECASSQRTPQSAEAYNKKDKFEEKGGTEKTEPKKYTPQIKSSQGVMLGKPKSLMKTIELREKRKRRREEMEEQQQQLAEQDDADKSSAWKAYMAQVKAYEARSCTDDDGHRRPLVK